MSNYCRGRWGREGAAARGDSVRGNPREDEGKPGRHGRKGDRRVDKKKKDEERGDGGSVGDRCNGYQDFFIIYIHNSSDYRPAI